VLKRADHPLGNGKGERGFADAAGADDRDQALLRELRDKRCRGFSRPIIRVVANGQVVRRRRQSRGLAVPATAPQCGSARRNCSPPYKRWRRSDCRRARRRGHDAKR